MKKQPLLILIGVLVATGLGAGFYFVSSPEPSPAPAVVVEHDPLFGWKFPVARTALGQPGQNLFDFQIAYSDIRDPGGIPSGLPVRLKIPVIGVNTAIEDAYITPDGRMDVPQGSVNVAWFALGPQPGEVGSAVIGGHFGIRNGVKFVFYDLDKLKIGDRVYTVDDRNDTRTFMVRAIRLFERDDDATPVFTSNDGLAHLNVITCEGIWNRVNDTYPLRRVIFTDEIPTEAVAPTPAPTFTPTPAPVSTPTPTRTVVPLPTPRPTPTASVPRTLTFGSQGADVAELQTALVERGFLTLPGGFVKGTYGSLTSEAVARYQTSVGLPSTGIFDGTTRTSLESTGFPVAGEPTPMVTPTPTPTVSPVSVPDQSSPILVRYVKNLYDSPIDGIITSLLLVGIAFTVFKIFWHR